MHTLRDGTATRDPRLDRLPEFDYSSRGFPIRAAGVLPLLRSYTWRLTTPYVIDQGSEGACVGFAVVNELQARPAEVRPGGLAAATKLARERIYWGAQMIDPWPGGAYPGAKPRYEGTSVLAGMKIAQQIGYFREYRWAFGLADLVHGLGRNGPAVLGINWHHDMYTPRNGWVRPTGPVVGGHAILARAVRVIWREGTLGIGWGDVDQDRSWVLLRNSWGPNWGEGGDARITLRDLGALLEARGEAAFALDRRVRL